MERVAIVSRLGAITGCFQEKSKNSLTSFDNRTAVTDVARLTVLLFILSVPVYRVLEAL